MRHRHTLGASEDDNGSPVTGRFRPVSARSAEAPAPPGGLEPPPYGFGDRCPAIRPGRYGTATGLRSPSTTVRGWRPASKRWRRGTGCGTRTRYCGLKGHGLTHKRILHRRRGMVRAYRLPPFSPVGPHQLRAVPKVGVEPTCAVFQAAAVTTLATGAWSHGWGTCPHVCPLTRRVPVPFSATVTRGLVRPIPPPAPPGIAGNKGVEPSAFQAGPVFDAGCPPLGATPRGRVGQDSNLHTLRVGSLANYCATVTPPTHVPELCDGRRRTSGVLGTGEGS